MSTHPWTLIQQNLNKDMLLIEKWCKQIRFEINMFESDSQRLLVANKKDSILLQIVLR